MVGLTNEDFDAFFKEMIPEDFDDDLDFLCFHYRSIWDVLESGYRYLVTLTFTDGQNLLMFYAQDSKNKSKLALKRHRLDGPAVYGYFPSDRGSNPSFLKVEHYYKNGICHDTEAMDIILSLGLNYESGTWEDVEREAFRLAFSICSSNLGPNSL